MRRRQSILGVAVLAAVAMALVAPPRFRGAEEAVSDPGAGPRQALAAADAQIREVRSQIAAHPEDATLWAGLVQMAAQRAPLAGVVQRMAGGGASEPGAAAADRGSAVVDPGAAVDPSAAAVDPSTAAAVDPSTAAALVICREWIAARPEEPAAYVTLARYLRSPADRSATLGGAAARFPASAEVAEAWAQELQRRGEGERARQALATFLDRNPDQPRAYELLTRHAQGQGDNAAADRVLAAWRQHFPGDPQMLDLWLGRELATAPPERARQLAAEAVERLEPSERAGILCEHLESLGGGALLDAALGCSRKVLAGDLPAASAERLAEGYGRAAAQAGELGELQRMVESLRPEARPGALLQGVFGLARKGRCAEAAEVARGIADHRDPHVDYPEHIARFLADCSAEPASRALYLELLAASPPAALPNLLASWRDRLPAETLETRPEGDSPEQALAPGAGSSPDDEEAAAQEHLALLMRTGGAGVADEAARFLAERYDASGRPPGGREESVAQDLAAAGFVAPALAWIERAIAHSPRRAALYEQQADLALRAGRADLAESACRKLLELDPRSSLHWLRLARLEAGRGQSERAIATVREAFAAIGSRPADLSLFLGRTYLARGETVRAIAIFEEVKAAHPDLGEVYDDLAGAYAKLADDPRHP